MRKRLIEAFTAVVVEESVRALLPPLLPYAWLAILWLLTWEILQSPKVKEPSVELYGRLGKRARMFSFFLVVMIGVSVSVAYWLGIRKIFAMKQITDKGSESAKPEAQSPDNRGHTSPEEPSANPPSMKPIPPAVVTKKAPYGEANPIPYASPRESQNRTPSVPAPEPETPKVGHEERNARAGTVAQPSVTFTSYLQPPEPYFNGTLLGGIVWDEKYVDVRLDLSNGGTDIENVDFLVGLNTSIFAMGQISQFSGITEFPAKSMPPMWLQGTDASGNPVSVPMAPTPGMPNGSPIYRVYCDKVFANTVIHFVIASVALNPPDAQGNLPQTLFAPRKAPRVIQIKGKYETSDPKISHPLEFSFQFPEQRGSP
jgi:hypothetical protein